MSPATPAALMGARYGSADAPEPAHWNATIETMLAHRSVRAYLPDPIPEDLLNILIATAQSASTSDYRQAWSMVVVQDPARKARLAELCGGQPSIHQAPVIMIWLADLHRIEQVAEDRAAPAEALPYLESLLVGLVDAALAAQNVQVAAESLGLGSVFIGAIRNRPDEVALELALPPKVAPLFGLLVGKADPALLSTVKPRLPQTVTVHRELYDRLVPMDQITRYDAMVKAQFRDNRLLASGWIATLLGRVGTRDALNGREHLREQLTAMGFELR